MDALAVRSRFGLSFLVPHLLLFARAFHITIPTILGSYVLRFELGLPVLRNPFVRGAIHTA
jgi:hypothetical protein